MHHTVLDYNHESRVQYDSKLALALWHALYILWSGLEVRASLLYMAT